ncbi:hypothetical protein SAMN05421882_100382 [Nitrosomonas communis]|uniref:Uncharacterized protein n=1 Tax=Nitrosomonas communis TaxID=44574 RepID=A0A1H2QZ83_9PROT|nr:hypothetical protein SAMN05421882_100382 [Nitrosomonas communis]
MLLLYSHPEFQFLFQSGGMNFLYFAFHHEGIATCLIILTISADAFSIKGAKKATSSSQEKILAPSSTTGELGCITYAAIVDKAPSKLARPAY